MDRIKALAREKIERLGEFLGTDLIYITKSGFWMNANFIVSSLFGLLSSVLFARLVSKDVYGTYQFILALASMIAVVAPNNMSSAVLRAVAQGYEGDFEAATKFQLRWGIIATAVSGIVAIWYALNHNVTLSIALIFVAILMPATYAFNTWGAYVQGKKDYKRYFYFSTLNTFISYGGLLLTLVFSRNLLWIVFANIFFGFLGNLVLYFTVVKKMKPGPKTDPETIPYGVHLTVMGIPQGLVGQVDALIIFHYIGASALAVYSFATLFPERLAGGLKFISSIAFPRFSEHTEENVRRSLPKKIAMLSIFIAFIVICYSLIAPYLFDWLFPQYEASVAYTQVYSLSFFSIIASMVQAALVSQKKTRELYYSTVSFPFIKAALLFVLMYFYGIWGVIAAQLIVIFFQIAFPLYLFERERPSPKI